MRTSDLVQVIFIFLIFISLYLFNILSVGIQNIQDNWPEYRCNPSVMPFASILGPDGTNSFDNFSYCVQNMQTNYMQYLLQPVNYNLDVMGNTTGSLTNAVNDVRAFISNLRDMLSTIVQSIMSVFLNIIIEFQKIIIDIKDLFGKLVGILASFMYILDGSVKTMESAWAGPNGQMVQALCFDPNTKIELHDNTIVNMEDIKLGDVLKNGSEVTGTMKLNNLDKQGNRIENYYKINGGVNGENIYVTGCHLMYEPKTMRFIKVKDYKNAVPTEKSNDYFSCLITSDHLMLIGSVFFHDWEDNDGTSAVNICKRHDN